MALKSKVVSSTFLGHQGGLFAFICDDFNHMNVMVNPTTYSVERNVK